MSDNESATAILDLLGSARLAIVLYDSNSEPVFSTCLAEKVLIHVNCSLDALLDRLMLDRPQEGLWYDLRETGTTSCYACHPAEEVIYELQVSRGLSGAGTPLVLIAEEATDEYWRERFRGFLDEQRERTPDGVAIADENQRVIYANPGMRRLIGLGPTDSLEGLRVEDAHEDGIGGLSVDEAFRLAREQGPYYTEAVIKSLRGSKLTTISQMLMAHRDPWQGGVFYSTTVRDISDLKQTQRELDDACRRLDTLLAERTRELSRASEQAEYSQEVWRSLVDNNRDLVLFTCRRGEIRFSNKGFIGHDSLELLDRNVIELLPEEDGRRIWHEYERLMQGEIDHFTTEGILEFRQRRWYCIFLVNRVQQRDGSHAATWLIADLSDEKRLREQVNAHEQMAATGRMAARVAHEINNPLAAINSSLELVRMDVTDRTDAVEYLTLMKSELNRVSEIVRQMYGLYRPAQGQPRCLSVPQLIRECLVLLRSDASARDVSMDVDAPQDIHAVVPEPSLRQVLYNTIINALDASPAGEKIAISVVREEAEAVVRIVDQGPGIDPEHARRIFEPFFTTKDTYSGQGLGLGLPVSASLVTEMGGSLQLKPAEQGGSVCELRLPGADC